MLFWRRSMGRSGTRISPGPWRTFPIIIGRLRRRGTWPPLSVTWNSVGLVTTIHFPSPADAIRSCARILQAGRRRQRVRVELRLDGEWKARYQGPYVEMAECGLRSMAVEPKLPKPVRKDHNAGGRSQWMQGFFDRPSPPLWKCVQD